MNIHTYLLNFNFLGMFLNLSYKPILWKFELLCTNCDSIYTLCLWDPLHSVGETLRVVLTNGCRRKKGEGIVL